MFLEFLGISTTSMVVTYVLFSKLKANADGKGKVWGASMTFGGSLAGFVIIFSLLFQAYSQLPLDKEQPRSDINIHGNWKLDIESRNGRKESGYATIQQESGNASFEIYAQIRDVNNQLITFYTEIAVLKGHHAIYVYETNKGEVGLGLGDIPKQKPDSFTMAYYDVANTDKNTNKEGTIMFTRIENTSSWKAILERLANR